MKPVHCLTAIAVALLTCAGTAGAAQNAASTVTAHATSPATAATASSDTHEQDDRILAAMNAASTWGHPDLFGEFAGMQRYAKGDYKSALKYFKYGAMYADKPSQLALGLMYANGLGVKKDAATGCAWLILAATRNSPRLVATRDLVCSALAPAQRQQADVELAKLQPVYGDTVARRRMATELRLAVTTRTGSHVGFDAGVSEHSGSDVSGFNTSAIVGSATRNCGSTLTVDGIPWPPKGCVGSDFWAPDRWNPKLYFAARDAHRIGTVTVGALQHVPPAGSAQATDGTPQH